MNSPARPSTSTAVLEPLDVASPEGLDWQGEDDVIVVGWGAAGACAALEASSHGATVRVVDRFEGGGASALSGGVVYAGGGTAQQREAGFHDTPEAMLEYLRHETQGVVSEATLRRFCADSAANLCWLEGHGVGFNPTMPDHKTSYPPDGTFLYYSGNEVVPAYAGIHPHAPRGHRAVSRGQSGAALYAALQRATLDADVQTVTQSAVRRLVRHAATGRVIGVEAWALKPGSREARRHAQCNARANRWRNHLPAKAEAWRREAAAIEAAHAQPQLWRARRAVVLATGGFIFHRDWVKQHAPAYRSGWRIGHAGCDGSGIRLGLGVGGQADRLDNVSAWRFITPPAEWPRGLVVNTRGERFCNEQVYGAALGHEIVAHQGGRAWLIFDAAVRARALRQCLFGGLWAFQRLPALALMTFGCRKSSTLAGLASRIGADPAVLQATVDAANAAADGGAEDPMGKSTDMRAPLRDAPFYAVDLSIGAPLFPLAVLTLGGLKVDEESGHVLQADGRRIPGLLAAGRAAIGLPSHRYVSGLSLADCVFSGRRAGRSAALHEPVTT